MTSWLVALTAPAFTTIALIAFLRHSRWGRRLADHPNERSLHGDPRPKIGGIAMMLAALPVALGVASGSLGMLWALALGLALLSFADDIRSLPIGVRLPAHFGAAAAAIASLAPLASDLALPFAVAWIFAIAWMTNLYNFMDGADGLAGGMTVVGFGAYVVAASQAQLPELALGAAVIVSAACAFLLFNFPPARVFMGDAGSIPLGFLAGSLGAYGAFAGAWSAWFPLLVFSPFVVDASVTIARRLVRRERIWIAHRSHAYQRLVLAGWTHRRLALALYGVALAAAASALAARTAGPLVQYAILAAWSGFYLVAMVAIERRKIPEAPRHEGA